MINTEFATHFSQFTFVTVEKILRNSHAHFREKIRKLRLRQNDSFLIEKVYLGY